MRLTAYDGAAGDLFGHSVAIDGDPALVGATHDDAGVNVDRGSAYVFVRDPRTGTLTERQKLTPRGGAADDQFGFSVAISCNTAVVDAPLDDAGANLVSGLRVRLRVGRRYCQDEDDRVENDSHNEENDADE
jgi:hypothetical protein